MAYKLFSLIMLLLFNFGFLLWQDLVMGSLLDSVLLQWSLFCSLFYFSCFTLLSALVSVTYVLYCIISFVLPLSMYGLNVFSHLFCLYYIYMSTFIWLCLLLFEYWVLKYCSAVIGICMICLVFLVMIHPVFMMSILYDFPLWSLLMCSIVVPCVQHLPSSLWKVSLSLCGGK